MRFRYPYGFGGALADPDLATGLVSLSMDFVTGSYGFESTDEAAARAAGITLDMNFLTPKYVV